METGKKVNYGLEYRGGNVTLTSLEERPRILSRSSTRCEKHGLLAGSVCQHSNMILYLEREVTLHKSSSLTRANRNM